jgi:hypothetical protein
MHNYLRRAERTGDRGEGGGGEVSISTETTVNDLDDGNPPVENYGRRAPHLEDSRIWTPLRRFTPLKSRAENVFPERPRELLDNSGVPKKLGCRCRCAAVLVDRRNTRWLQIMVSYILFLPSLLIGKVDNQSVVYKSYF